MQSSRRVAVIGSTGQLGSDLVRVLKDQGHDVRALIHEDMDVCDSAAVQRVIGEGAFDVVVNTAALHRVDECEDRPDEAFRLNALAPHRVARACEAAGSLCVFISTDYVFDGDGIGLYTEESQALPLNVYGASKLAGEQLVRQATARSLVLRISSVFGRAGARGKGGNFIEAILQKARTTGHLTVVNDNWMTPTYTMDAARHLASLIDVGATGVVHASNAGRCTWFDFAKAAVDRVGLSVQVEAVSAGDFPGKARRPKDSSLDVSHLESFVGYRASPWQDALERYLLEKGHIA